MNEDLKEKISILEKKLEISELHLQREYNKVEELYKFYGGDTLDSKKVWEKYNNLIKYRLQNLMKIYRYRKQLK